ncbi:MAG TPA: TetR/AcrR family transcriptional regulator [Pseudonocardiaceae bacterium]|jgi:AcrR family transcriptional regulator|nr:TetR/AcrR family transcriptional regulator [Pseudonocardiaceae bacterium]
MSEFTAIPRRRRRSDAERSVSAILDAARAVLGERPDASIADIAAAAGVTRQTVYAHYPSRDALLAAVIDRATDDAIDAIDAARIEEGPAAEALTRFLDASWATLDRYPLLLNLPAIPTDPQADRDRHEPVVARLHRLIRRGQDSGEFDPQLPPAWLLAATIALGHTAGEQVANRTMSADDAITTLKRSVLRLFGATGTEQA